jgi:hypothetical protein
MVGEAIYLLSTALSLLCTLLLLRSYRRTGTRLLLWSAICFAGLCANNALLFVDIIIFPTGDLSVQRVIPAIIGLAALCYGLIWEAT